MLRITRNGARHPASTGLAPAPTSPCLPASKTLLRSLAVLASMVACGMAPLCAHAAEIGVTMVPPVGFFKFLRDGIDAHARQLSDVKVLFAFAEAGAGAAQVEQVKAYIGRHVDGLVVLPVDADATAEITRLAREANTPLVFVNNGPREDWFAGRVALAIPNDMVAGRLQMDKLASLLGGKGQIVIIKGPASHSAAALRTQGVREILAQYPDIRVIEEDTAEWDRRKARDLMAGWLRKGDRIDAVAANNDEMALGAVAAIADAGLPDGKIIVAGIDGLPDAVEAIKARKMTFSVLQDAQKESSKALDDVLDLISNKPTQQFDWVSFELMTPQTLEKAARAG